MSIFSRMVNKLKQNEKSSPTKKMTQEVLKNRLQITGNRNLPSTNSAHLNDNKSANKFVAKSSAEFNPNAFQENSSKVNEAKNTKKIKETTNSPVTNLATDSAINKTGEKPPAATTATPMIAGGEATTKKIAAPAEYSAEQVELFNKLPERLQQLVLDTFHCFIRIETSAAASMAKEDSPLNITDSKFGGVPYIPANLQIDEPYPMSSDDTPLMLLAQINFAQVFAQVSHADFAHLPAQGLLQIFINAGDESLGLADELDFLQRLPSKDYHVRFFPTIDKTATQLTNAEELANNSVDESVMDEVFSPISMPLKLSFSKAFGCAGVSENLLEFMEANQGQGIDELDYENGEKEDIAYEAINQLSNAGGHKLLGMPVFPNEEVRKPYSKQQLLLQIDSEYPMNEAYEIMWGDMGVANFFIQPKELAEQNFSKLLYNWDSE